MRKHQDQNSETTIHSTKRRSSQNPTTKNRSVNGKGRSASRRRSGTRPGYKINKKEADRLLNKHGSNTSDILTTIICNLFGWDEESPTSRGAATGVKVAVIVAVAVIIIIIMKVQEATV